VAVAVVLSHTGLNQDIFEGWVMLAAAFFVVSMVIFMMRRGPQNSKARSNRRSARWPAAVPAGGCLPLSF